MVDALNFLRDFNSADSLRKRNQAATANDERHVTDLLTDQVSFSIFAVPLSLLLLTALFTISKGGIFDVIILNKADLVAEEDMAQLKQIVRRLNSVAKIITSTRSNVPLTEILNTGLFSYERAEKAPGWLKEMRGEHLPETEE